MLEVWKRFVEDPRKMRPYVDSPAEFQGMYPITAKLAYVSHVVQGGLDSLFIIFRGKVCVDLGRAPCRHFEPFGHLLGG